MGEVARREWPDAVDANAPYQPSQALLALDDPADYTPPRHPTLLPNAKRHADAVQAAAQEAQEAGDRRLADMLFRSWLRLAAMAP
jgi:hypothetical protein